MENPIAAPLPKRTQPKAFDPLSTDDEMKYSKYEWYKRF
jgi:hypothetical protein